jgi:hypothetical protein
MKSSSDIWTYTSWISRNCFWPGAPGPDSRTWDVCQPAIGKDFPCTKNSRSFPDEYGLCPSASSIHAGSSLSRKAIYRPMNDAAYLPSGASHTWENTKSMRANSERLAPPQVATESEKPLESPHPASPEPLHSRWPVAPDGHPSSEPGSWPTSAGMKCRFRPV